METTVTGTDKKEQSEIIEILGNFKSETTRMEELSNAIINKVILLRDFRDLEKDNKEEKQKEAVSIFSDFNSVLNKMRTNNKVLENIHNGLETLIG